MKCETSKLIPGVISAAIWITLLTLFLASLARTPARLSRLLVRQ